MARSGRIDHRPAYFLKKAAVRLIGNVQRPFVEPKPNDDHLPLRNDKHIIVVVPAPPVRPARAAGPLTLPVRLNSVNPPVVPVNAPPVGPAQLLQRNWPRNLGLR